MAPFGAMTTSEGRLKVSGPLPATPALPSVISSFPSALNLNTWWPLPSLPSGSSFTIGGTLEPTQWVLPQRSNTQMLPLRSRSTPLVLPHFLPSGSLPQPSSRRYGVCWARTGIATIAASAAASSRVAMHMMAPPVGSDILSARTFTEGAPRGFNQTHRVGDGSRRSRGGRPGGPGVGAHHPPPKDG